jgi:hypothetical protein
MTPRFRHDRVPACFQTPFLGFLSRRSFQLKQLGVGKTRDGPQYLTERDLSVFIHVGLGHEEQSTAHSAGAAAAENAK